MKEIIRTISLDDSELEMRPNLEIKPSPMDIPHTVKSNETLSKLAYFYYDNPNMGRFILLRNPELKHEFNIREGIQIFIPMPMNRITPFLKFFE